MDPDANINIQRFLIQRILRDPRIPEEDEQEFTPQSRELDTWVALDTLADASQALSDWLDGGGFQPSTPDWRLVHAVGLLLLTFDPCPCPGGKRSGEAMT